MKKTIYTLNVNGYAPEVTALTYPLLRRYADKIGAGFEIISIRKWPGLPPVYEKLQIHELGKANDWSIYIDSDALVHPDTFDVTEHLSKDTVMQYGRDLAGNRWRYDDYFRRDGRHISACNWFTVASDWCLDLWQPLTDLTFEEAVGNIYPLVCELATVITPEHLIDDYVLSRNIARYGLKFTTFKKMIEPLDPRGDYLWHRYMMPVEEKIAAMKETLKGWGL